MILTTCAACAAPLAHDAPRCIRCKLRYCSATCQHDHWRRGHKQMCKKIHRGGNAEQYHANKKYKETVAVAYRTMMCYPNSERMYESLLDLSDALEITDHVIENKKLLESFWDSAVKKFGEKHLLIFKLRYNHAQALYMYHFFGYDGYIALCDVAISFLEQLEEQLASYPCNTREKDEVLHLLHSTSALLVKAQNHRLE